MRLVSKTRTAWYDSGPFMFGVCGGMYSSTDSVGIALVSGSGSTIQHAGRLWPDTSVWWSS
jgi:hypothetical protein